MIRILIADDHRLFRETLGELLGARDGLEIVALCGDSDSAVNIAQREHPDVIMLDIRMKPLSGVAATRIIRNSSNAKIIGLSMYSLPCYATSMFGAGANGYISKNSPLEEIFTGIEAVMQGKKYLCRELRDMMVNEVMETEPGLPHISMLTAREIEVAQLLSKGQSSREIALALNCAYKTIEAHRHHMLKKLQLKNTNELINFLFFQVPDLL